MDLEQWNEYHQNQTEKDVSKLLQLLDEVLKMAVLYYSMQALNKGSDLFTFALYPVLNKKINSLFERFQNTFSRKMNFYVDKHYNISHNKFKDVFGEALKSGKAATYTPASVRKHLPMEGIRSARVWNLSKQYRTEIEMALDIAISEGTPANELASTLKKYLRNPDSLFRRYRDKNGVLQLSKKAKEYQSGQGVYRSAYKNAERLARTEINIAYRKADIERWQSMDMIAGYEIKRSRHPYSCEICDMMKGVYPKSFVWVGNHPNCRCYMTPIFKDDLKGKELTLNPKLTNWIASHEEKVTTASSVPMFLWGVDGQSVGISQKVIQAIQPFSRSTYVAFEPFSPVIVERLKKIKHNADKQKLLQEIIDDNRAKLVFQHETNGAKTVIFDLHRGKGESLNNTLAMAKALNEKGKSVALLPEYDKISSADAIVEFKNKLVIADFKYLKSKKINTLQKELYEGFEQIGISKSDYIKEISTIVLKLENGNTDLFVQAIEYLKRNNKDLGNITLINKYNKIKELERKDLIGDRYKKIIKGFL
nr:MAG TPA: putative head morphogenesis protein [Caudoviricetes sp.]